MATNNDDDEGQNVQGAKPADRLLHIGKDCAAHLKEPFRSADHGTILYDGWGLPRPSK
jgi:antitoxin VapB